MVEVVSRKIILQVGNQSTVDLLLYQQRKQIKSHFKPTYKDPQGNLIGLIEGIYNSRKDIRNSKHMMNFIQVALSNQS